MELILTSKDLFEQMEIKPDYEHCFPMCCKVMMDNFRE